MANPDVPIWIDVATGDFAQTIPDEDVGYIGEANDGNPQAQYVSCEGIAAVGLSYTAASTQVYGIAPITFSVQPPNMRVEFGGP